MRALSAIFVLAVTVLTIPTAQITALPLNDPPLANGEDCIKMTKAASAEVDDIIDKISKFFDLLEEKFPKYNLRLVKLDIGKQIESKTDEQSSVLEIFINDCNKSSKDYNNDESTNKHNANDAEPTKIKNESDYTGTTTSYFTKPGISNSESQNGYNNSNDDKSKGAETNRELNKQSRQYRISTNWKGGKYLNDVSTSDPNRRVNRKYRSTSTTNDTNKTFRNFETMTNSEKKTAIHTYSEINKSSINNNYNQPELTTSVYSHYDETTPNYMSSVNENNKQQVKNVNENFNNYDKNLSMDNNRNFEISTTTSVYDSNKNQINNNENGNNNGENAFADNIRYSTESNIPSVNNNNNNNLSNVYDETNLTDDTNKSINNIPRNSAAKEYQSASEVETVSSYKKETSKIDNISTKDTKSTTSNLNNQEKTVNIVETKTEEISIDDKSEKSIDKVTKNQKSQSTSNFETGNEYNEESSTEGSNNRAEKQGTYYNNQKDNTAFNGNSEQPNVSFAENQFIKYLKTMIRNEVKSISNNDYKGNTYNNNISADYDKKINKLMNDFNDYQNNVKSTSTDNNKITLEPQLVMLEMPDNKMFEYVLSKRGGNGPFLVYMQEGNPPRQWII